MELDFGTHLEEQMQRGVMPHGIVELIIGFGELEHRCGVEHYSVTKSTIKRIQRYFGHNSSRILDFYTSHYAITIKNRVITVAKKRPHHTENSE